MMNVSSGSEKKRKLEYPFSKTWVYASCVMAGLTIVFSIIILKDVESIRLLDLSIHPLVAYFFFVAPFTIIMVRLKLYLYSRGGDDGFESHGYEDPKERSKRLRRRRWLVLIVFFLVVVALFSPVLLSIFVEPLWSFICISGFVPIMTIPEVILYIYSQRT